MSKTKENFFMALTSGLGFLGVLVQGYYTLQRQLNEGHSLIYGLNHYFSYFTIIINTSLAVLLASCVLAPESKMTLWFRRSVVNAAFTLYILIVGIIFYLLLYNPSVPMGPDQLATHILHGYVPPAYFLIWFFVFRKNDLHYKHSLWWLLMPLLYFGYILVRGAFLNAYPYFFVNAVKYGYGQVMINAVAILVVFLLLGCMIVFMDTKLKVRQIDFPDPEKVK